MKQLTLNDYQRLAMDPSSFVINIDNFNINVRFFFEDSVIHEHDEDFLSNRTKIWKSRKDDYGTEFFYSKDDKITGVITYGIIQ